jgi:hypothetical protein
MSVIVNPAVAGGSGSVTSVGTLSPLIGGPITTSGTISMTNPDRVVAAGTDTILATDLGSRVAYNNAGAVAVTLPQAGTGSFINSFYFYVANANSAGAVTITPTTSTINGNATLVLNLGDWCFIGQNTANTQWRANCMPSQLTAGSNISLTGAAHSLTIAAVPAYPVTVTGGVSGGVPYFNSTTQESSSALLAANGVVLGGGAGTAPATNTGLTYSAGNLSVGVAGTSTAVITGAGVTSGTATLTWPAVAGTSTNAIVSSNVIQTPAGTNAAPGFAFSSAGSTGMFTDGTGDLKFSRQSSQLLGINSTGPYIFNATVLGFLNGSFAQDTGLSRTAAGVLGVGTGASASVAGSISLAGVLLNGKVAVSGTAPTISSGFGGTPSISANNGTIAFRVNVGTGGSATSGVIGLPTASTGWNCQCTDITTTSSTVFITKQTASSTTSATVGNFTDTGSTGAWTASDILACSCFGY